MTRDRQKICVITLTMIAVVANEFAFCQEVHAQSADIAYVNQENPEYPLEQPTTVPFFTRLSDAVESLVSGGTLLFAPGVYSTDRQFNIPLFIRAPNGTATLRKKHEQHPEQDLIGPVEEDIKNGEPSIYDVRIIIDSSLRCNLFSNDGDHEDPFRFVRDREYEGCPQVIEFDGVALGPHIIQTVTGIQPLGFSIGQIEGPLQNHNGNWEWPRVTDNFFIMHRHSPDTFGPFDPVKYCFWTISTSTGTVS